LTALNEGRGPNPSDTPVRARGTRGYLPLNEGRGPNPSDTRNTSEHSRSATTLNEGRGPNPSDTIHATPGEIIDWTAQRRPGPEPQRHGLRRGAASARDPALNEGRGPNPSDTRFGVSCLAPLDGRSTKAGARTPATPPSRAGRRSAFHAQRRPGPEPQRHKNPMLAALGLYLAQRRPGPEPQRHAADLEKVAAAAGRSTKAGARTPATRLTAHFRLQHLRAPLNEGRGPNPSDTSRPQASLGCSRSLNEGRGPNPSDTGRPVEQGKASRARSTKAGARTPATPVLKPKKYIDK